MTEQRGSGRSRWRPARLWMRDNSQRWSENRSQQYGVAVGILRCQSATMSDARLTNQTLFLCPCYSKRFSGVQGTACCSVWHIRYIIPSSPLPTTDTYTPVSQQPDKQ